VGQVGNLLLRLETIGRRLPTGAQDAILPYNEQIRNACLIRF